MKREAAALYAEARALEQGESSTLQTALDSLEQEDSITRTNIYVNNMPDSPKDTVRFDMSLQENSAVNQNEHISSHVISDSNQHVIHSTDLSTPTACVPLQNETHPTRNETRQSESAQP